MQIFDKPEDHDAYQELLSSSENGFVINEVFRDRAFNLHHVSCSDLKRGSSGRSTEVCRKICSDNIEELRQWANINNQTLYEGCKCLNS
jgi:hypothetical protein